MSKTLKFTMDLNRPFNFITFLAITALGVYLFGPKFLFFTVAYNFRHEVADGEADQLKKLDEEASAIRDQFRRGGDKIQAIKAVRELYRGHQGHIRFSLRGAKDYVES